MQLLEKNKFSEQDKNSPSIKNFTIFALSANENFKICSKAKK